VDGLVIREATILDATALQRYAAELFSEGLPGIYRRETPTLEEEREFIRAHLLPNAVLLLAEKAGEIVGEVGFQGRTLPQERHVGTFGIAVARDHRGQGIGTALIEALIAWAPQRGITRIEGEAFSVNERAMGLYKRLGFQEEGRRRGAVYVDGEICDVVMLGLLLPPAPTAR
jgi:RimJ/RimL family protein N-acetyltransferase